jgi:PKHD-type hydroxylase
VSSVETFGEFGADFCAASREFLETLPGRRGTVGYPFTDRYDGTARRVTARKFKRGGAGDWILDALDEHIARKNAETWRFDLEPQLEFAIFMSYDAATEDVFHWHYDELLEDLQPRPRKLSLTIKLSDPSEYDGGVFEFQSPIGPIPLSVNGLGSTVLFPSYRVHRVTPITRGVRHALVAWSHGPRWR